MRIKAIFVGLLFGYLVILPLPSSAQMRRGQGTAPARTAASGRYHALLIAVQTYRDPNINSLDHPLKDARQLKQALTTYYSFEPNNVMLLENPSREAILATLDRFAEKLMANDNLLIFYAGHGYWDEERRQGYWLPGDARQSTRSGWISNGDIRDAIRALKARHILLISDACFSGSLILTREAFTPPPAIEEANRRLSRKAMTSGALTTVPDRSVFVEYLLRRLRENTEPYLLAGDLYSQLRTPVINNSPSQPDGNIPTPKYGAIHDAGDDDGEFFFVRRANAPALSYTPARPPGPTPADAPPLPAASSSSPAPGLVATLRQAESSLRRCDFDQAMRGAKNVLAADPNNGVAHRLQAEAYYFYQHDDERTEQERDEAHRLLRAPEGALQYEALGWVYLNKRDVQSAISACTEAIRLDPEYVSAYVVRGTAYFNNRDYNQAMADLNEAIRLDPKFVKAYIRRGELNAVKGEDDRAIEDLNKAIRLAPSFAEAYYSRARVHCSSGHCGRAMEDLNEAIRLAPKFVDAYLRRADLHCANGDCDLAIADLSKAIRLKPKSAAAYNHRGMVYSRKREYSRAIEDLNEAIRLDPKLAEAYFNRAKLYDLKHDHDQAIEDFTEAIHLDPKFADAYSGRARAYASIGRHDLADADERKAASLNRKR